MDWSAIAVWGDVARRNAVVRPDKIAFSGARGQVSFQVSFGAANARMNRLNAALRSFGLGKGDRVAVLARNRSEYFEVLGVAKSGLIAVPLNWRLSPRELGHVIAECRPSAIVVEPPFAPAIDGLRGEFGEGTRFIAFDAAPDGWLSYEALLDTAAAGEIAAEVSPDDVVCLMYSSGTTGLPKGAMLTHRGVLANARVQGETALTLTSDDRLLDVLPFFHVGGMWYFAFAGYARGVSAVILPEFEPRAVLAALREEAITTLHLVPTMIEALLREQETRPVDLSRLRVLLYAASPMPLDLLKRALAALPATGFVQSYGSTESGAVTYLTAAEHRAALADHARARRLRSCGRTSSGIDVTVRGFGGGDAAAGEIGEVMVRGPRMMKGYWRNEALTHEAFDDGWLRMGDLGYFDEDGFLYLVDRKNDMIVTGGENVYPSEVETELLDDPAIAEAAVFGVPDSKWIEMVAAAIVLRPGATATEDDIVARLRLRVASYKCPKRILIRDRLPRNAAGKILRKTLRAEYGASPD
jgi:acyl-CoA synthetase (AMP-forming)/AMP-acid ligase II